MTKHPTDFGSCSTCGSLLLLPCSTCLRPVRIKDGKYVAHETSKCKGSHMEYGSCPGGGQKVPT